MGLLAYLKTQFVLHLLIGFVFVVSGLVINFIQLCTLVLWPLNKQLYRRLNCRLAYSLWSREYRAPLGLLLGGPQEAGVTHGRVQRCSTHTRHEARGGIPTPEWDGLAAA